jgi:DNA-binding transcriptional LysR family regulator
MAAAGGLNLNRLRTFEAVARLESVTAAARELALSQPAVTVQLRELERGLGAALLDRGRGRRVALTHDGERLAAYARQIVSLAREAERAMGRDAVGGRLPLVATPTAASYLLPRVIGEFQRRHPRVQIELRVVNSREAVARLRAREADVGILTGAVSDPRLIASPFVEDRLVLAVGARHRLARRRAVAARELAGLPLIMREQGSATRALIESELRRVGVRPEVAMEVASAEATLRLLAAGPHAAVLSAEIVRRDVEAGLLAALTIRGVRLRRTFWLAVPRERAEDPTVRALLEAARAVIRRPPPRAGASRGSRLV